MAAAPTEKEGGFLSALRSTTLRLMTIPLGSSLSGLLVMTKEPQERSLFSRIGGTALGLLVGTAGIIAYPIVSAIACARYYGAEAYSRTPGPRAFKAVMGFLGAIAGLQVGLLEGVLAVFWHSLLYRLLAIEKGRAIENTQNNAL